jgi:hypothetical protein
MKLCFQANHVLQLLLGYKFPGSGPGASTLAAMCVLLYNTALCLLCWVQDSRVINVRLLRVLMRIGGVSSGLYSIVEPLAHSDR